MTVPNIQSGLRYSDSLFQAINEELVTRLKSANLYEHSLRGQDKHCNAMVAEASENLNRR